MRCERSCPAIDFLDAALNHSTLSHHCRGIAFLRPGTDPLFKHLYLNYKKWMIKTRMLTPYDANHITAQLRQMGIEHFGRMLMHDLQTTQPSDIAKLDDVFGKGYRTLVGKVAATTKTKLRNNLQDINKSVLFSCKLVEGADTFKRYLLVLYKFRSAYFHGDLEPRSQATQLLARTAYLSLRAVMESAI